MSARALYREYRITYNPKPGPRSRVDYDWCHVQYDGGDVDGETPSRDKRCGNAESLEACLDAIDEQCDEDAEGTVDTRHHRRAYFDARAAEHDAAEREQREQVREELGDAASNLDREEGR